MKVYGRGIFERLVSSIWWKHGVAGAPAARIRALTWKRIGSLLDVLRPLNSASRRVLNWLALTPEAPGP